jgi:hypothetical protein
MRGSARGSTLHEQTGMEDHPALMTLAAVLGPAVMTEDGDEADVGEPTSA